MDIFLQMVLANSHDFHKSWRLLDSSEDLSNGGPLKLRKSPIISWQ